MEGEGMEGEEWKGKVEKGKVSKMKAWKEKVWKSNDGRQGRTQDLSEGEARFFRNKKIDN